MGFCSEKAAAGLGPSGLINFKTPTYHKNDTVPIAEWAKKKMIIYNYMPQIITFMHRYDNILIMCNINIK